MQTIVLFLKALVLAMQTFEKVVRILKDKKEADQAKFYNKARGVIGASLDTIANSENEDDRLDAGEDLEDVINSSR